MLWLLLLLLQPSSVPASFQLVPASLQHRGNTRLHIPNVHQALYTLYSIVSVHKYCVHSRCRWMSLSQWRPPVSQRFVIRYLALANSTSSIRSHSPCHGPHVAMASSSTSAYSSHFDVGKTVSELRHGVRTCVWNVGAHDVGFASSEQKWNKYSSDLVGKMRKLWHSMLWRRLWRRRQRQAGRHTGGSVDDDYGGDK